MKQTSVVISLPSPRDRKSPERAAPPFDQAYASAESQTLIIVCLVFLAFAVIGFLTAPEIIVF